MDKLSPADRETVRDWRRSFIEVHKRKPSKTDIRTVAPPNIREIVLGKHPVTTSSSKAKARANEAKSAWTMKRPSEADLAKLQMPAKRARLELERQSPRKSPRKTPTKSSLHPLVSSVNMAHKSPAKSPRERAALGESSRNAANVSPRTNAATPSKSVVKANRFTRPYDRYVSPMKLAGLAHTSMSSPLDASPTTRGASTPDKWRRVQRRPLTQQWNIDTEDTIEEEVTITYEVSTAPMDRLDAEHEMQMMKRKTKRTTTKANVVTRKRKAAKKVSENYVRLSRNKAYSRQPKAINKGTMYRKQFQRANRQR